MAFWGNIFGRKNNRTEVHVSEQKGEAEQIPMLYFSLSSKEEQKRIMDFIHPITDIWQIQNLEMSYGVRVEDAGIFMVRSRTKQSRIPNSDEYLYITYFLVLEENKCYEVSYTANNLRDEGDLTFSISQGKEEILKQAMDFYRNWDLHKVFDKEQKAVGIDTLCLNNELKKPLFEEYEAYTKELKKQSKQKKTILINSEQEAKELFFKSYRTLKKEYTEETIKAFEKYATRKKMKEWVMEECRQILDNIAGGDTENAYDKLRHINGNCSYFLGSDSELLAGDYVKACKTLFDCGEETFVSQIPSYVSYFQKSKNPFAIEGLLQLTEKYYAEKFTDEDLLNDTSFKEFKEICAAMRGIMRELSPIDNAEGFAFIFTPDDYLRLILMWYRNKYNDDEAVKECVAELNCAYGVQNSKLFITGRNEIADSNFSQTWDYSEFIVILLETKEIVEIRCRRQDINGGFVSEYKSDLINEYWPLLEKGMEYYRNHAVRNDFFDAYEQENESKSIKDLMKKSHKKLLSKFKRHYENEYKLAKENPLSKSLLKLVNLCEEKAPVYGYKNTKMNKPATAEEISAWEQDNNMLLPDTYKQFLLFANGICVFHSSEIIYGLPDLKMNMEHLEPDYIAIGEIIGDGTTICMSKSSGKIFVEDHGKYEDKGIFVEFLDWFIEFLEGCVI